MTPPVPLQLPTDDEALGWVEARTAEGLARAREVVAGLKDAASAGEPEALDVLRRWDEVTLALSNVGALSSLLANVHPDEAVRTASETAEIEVDKLVTELRQDRALYEVFAGVDASGLDAVTARLLDKTLEDFTRAGVDRDDATRARLAEINERLTALDQEFSRNIRDDVRYVKVAPDRLAGLPQDWLDEHPVDDEGLVAVSTDYPDIGTRPDVRPRRPRCGPTWPRRSSARAGRRTTPLLKEMFDLRHELAGLVGYDDWASYDAAVKMIGSGPAIPEFIDKIADAAEKPMRRDLESLLERLRRDVPDAEHLDATNSSYYEELVRKEQHDVDSQLVRTYFPFESGAAGAARGDRPAVRAALRAGAGRHHLARGRRGLRRAPGRTRQIGRIYLDLFPREGKYKHAAQFTIANGVGGRQLPEGALVCNFNRGLMEHDHVVTLFHEFGHLVHHVLGGQASVHPVLRRRDRVGLRRGAEPDARGVGLGRRHPPDASPATQPASRSRPTWSTGCARPTTSARGSRPGSRCSTRRCPTGSTPSGRPT